MKNVCGLILVFLLIGSQQAAAVLITLDAPDRVSAGSDLEVDVNVSGLSPGDLVGAFSFTFGISDNALVQFLPFLSSFGGELGDFQFGESVVGVSSQTVGQGTFIDVFEVSLLTSQELLDRQNGLSEFTLFTFGLNSLPFPGLFDEVVGVSVFDIVLSDDFGNQITLDSPATVGAFITLVPEPSTLMLLGLGIIGIASFYRRTSSSAGFDSSPAR